MPPRVGPAAMTTLRAVGHHRQAPVDAARAGVGPAQVPRAVTAVDGAGRTPPAATGSATAPHVPRRGVPPAEVNVVVTTAPPAPTRVRAGEGRLRPYLADVVAQVAKALLNVVHVAVQDAGPGVRAPSVRQLQGLHEVVVPPTAHPPLEVAEGPRVPPTHGPRADGATPRPQVGTVAHKRPRGLLKSA